MKAIRNTELLENKSLLKKKLTENVGIEEMGRKNPPLAAQLLEGNQHREPMAQRDPGVPHQQHKLLFESPVPPSMCFGRHEKEAQTEIK